MADPWEQPLSPSLADIARQVAAHRLRRGVMGEQATQPRDIPSELKDWGPTLDQLKYFSLHPSEYIQPGAGNLGGGLGVFRPWVARLGRSWNPLSRGGLPSEEARKLYERHIGVSPKTYLSEMYGPYAPRQALLAQSVDAGAPTLHIDAPLTYQGIDQPGYNISRDFIPSTGSVYHANMTVPPHLQGQGIGSELFGRGITNYPQFATPFNRITGSAVTEGAHVWPGLGTLTSQGAWNAMRRTHFPKRLDVLRRKTNISPEQINEAEHYLDEPSPMTMWDIRNLRSPLMRTDDVWEVPQGRGRNPDAFSRYMMYGMTHPFHFNINDPNQMRMWLNAKSRSRP